MLVIYLEYYFIKIFVVEASPELFLNVILQQFSFFHRLII